MRVTIDDNEIVARKIFLLRMVLYSFRIKLKYVMSSWYFNPIVFNYIFFFIQYENSTRIRIVLK
jgi:hypothetical protein